MIENKDVINMEDLVLIICICIYNIAIRIIMMITKKIKTKIKTNMIVKTEINKE